MGSYAPRFDYTDRMVGALGRIEAARAVVDVLPLPPDAGLSLRLHAVQKHTRSSTAIEGNMLSAREFRQAIVQAGPRQGAAAEQEVRNYWRGLEVVEEFSDRGVPANEDFIRRLHATIIVRLRGRRTPSAYRVVECPVVDSSTGTVDYAPPEPKDVPALMEGLVHWLHADETQQLPVPVRAAILSHRFLSIHPFEDGNGRTGRLLATAELWRAGYRMRGFFSFEEFFDADRARYYRSLQMGLPIDFYDGRGDADLTEWVEYFVETMAQAADELHERAQQLRELAEPEPMPWEMLSRRQKQVLTRLLLGTIEHGTAQIELRPADIKQWFEVSAPTARAWLHEWVDDDFIVPVAGGRSQRIRNYQLSPAWKALVEHGLVTRSGEK